MPEYHITQEKKDELASELDERRGTKRADILKRLEAARELGDLKENAEYHAMRDLQGKNESRIREIEEILKHAVVVEKSMDGAIALASEVKVKRNDSGAESMFTIVGPQESDILSGKIADKIGRAHV